MKDAKGHGSNKRPIPNSPFHGKTNDELRFIQRDAHEAGRNAQGMGDERGVNKYADQVNDAATVLGYRARGGTSDAPADQLHSGTPKSDAAPTHDGMGSISRGMNATTPASRGPAPWYDTPLNEPKGYNEHGSRHGYNPASVNEAINAQNRSGRGKIGGREASAIHRLLKGR